MGGDAGRKDEGGGPVAPTAKEGVVVPIMRKERGHDAGCEEKRRGAAMAMTKGGGGRSACHEERRGAAATRKEEVLRHKARRKRKGSISVDFKRRKINIV